MKRIITFLTLINISAFAQAQEHYPQPQYQAPPTKQYNQAPSQYNQAPTARRPPAQNYQSPPPAQYNQAPAARRPPAQPRRGYAEPRNYDPYYYNTPPPRYYQPRRKKKKRGFSGFNFNNPKKSMSDMWDDGWKEPSNWGDMPGGWSFPDISLPNPVDTVNDFGEGMQDLPKGFQQNNQPSRPRTRPRPRYNR